MKIRITGTEDELNKFVEDLRSYYDISSVSSFYKNNRKVKESKEGRIYIEARMTIYDPKTGMTTTI